MDEADGPVAYTTDLNFDDQTSVIHETEKGRLGTWRNDIPLFTTPFAWRNLTDQEIHEAIDDVLEGGGWLDVARAIEKLLREKNYG